MRTRTRRFGRPFILATLATALVTGVVSAAYVTPAPPSGNAGTISGIGATFPSPIYTKWFTYFKSAYSIGNASTSCSLTAKCASFTYAANGSGAGVNSVKGASMTADYGASDVIMTPSELTTASGNGRTILHIPLTLGGVVLGYRLDGVSTTLKLDKSTVNNIYAGNITYWDDAAIKALNSSVTLPHTPIYPYHRADASGTQQVFESYLVASPTISPFSGTTPSKSWIYSGNATGYGASGSAGVASSVKNQNGAIGFLELSYVTQYALKGAQLKNPAGTYVSPTTTAFTAAASTATPLDTTYVNGVRYNPIINASGTGSWPIVTFSYALVSQDAKQTPGYGSSAGVKSPEMLLAYLYWAIQSTGGQSYSAANGYAPLPSGVVTANIATLKKITCSGCTGHSAGYLWNP